MGNLRFNIRSPSNVRPAVRKLCLGCDFQLTYRKCRACQVLHSDDTTGLHYQQAFACFYQ
jgi:hypothetical protein